jgi:hypothetical protein
VPAHADPRADIGIPILPRFFLVTHQSGVKCIHLCLDGARERLLAQGHAVIEVVSAMWTYEYANGYTVTLRGPLTAHVIVSTPHTGPQHPNGRPLGFDIHSGVGNMPFSLKIDNLEFECVRFDKLVNMDSVLGHRMQEPPRTPRMRKLPGAGGTPTLAARDPRFEEEERGRMWEDEEPRVIIERASIPGDPVNAFGIPQATMRCLEVS